MSDLKRTVLADFHENVGAKMVPFAGWEMPVQYPLGVMKEHLQTREAAGLFDVSHMGQVLLRGDGAAEALERLVPADIVGLEDGRQRYALFTNDEGGILDDLMVANKGDHLFVVVNAARAEHDLAHMRKGLPGLEVEHVTDRALVALQGPKAEEAFARIVPDCTGMSFMDVTEAESDFGTLWISRSGYTGEDGFEISVPNVGAVDFVKALAAMEEVEPIGLGARDSLRLEAGLCLYGNDIDETTTPIEAKLAWAIGKARRTGGDREGGFPGADRVLKEMAEGASRHRVGLQPEARAPMRDGTEIFDGDTKVGTVTSGAFGPSFGGPVSMGYVDAEHSAKGTTMEGEVRGKRMPVTVAALPFVPAGFKR